MNGAHYQLVHTLVCAGITACFYVLYVCLQVGRNCLHVAITEGHVGIVKKLLASAGCELTRMEVSVLRVR